MARIRTIKPDFFTSEDVVRLTPMARLLYIATWMEADREGRMVWRPGTLKLRYLPGDDCEVLALTQELINGGLIVLYEAGGQQLAHIPTFTRHQIINNRETPSVLPTPPDACTTRAPRVTDAPQTLDDAPEVVERATGTPLVGKEGKGKEGKEHASATRAGAAAQGTRLPSDWVLPEDWRAYCVEKRSDLDPDAVAENFRDYWHGKAGKDGRMADWRATWQRWVRNESARAGQRPAQAVSRSFLHADHVFGGAEA